MNLKAIVVITGLTLTAGLNLPASATRVNSMTAPMGQASSVVDQAIAQATPSPGDAMKKPTTGATKKPATGAMSHPTTGDAMKKPATGAMSHPNTGEAMSHPTTGDAMKKPTSDAMQKQ